MAPDSPQPDSDASTLDDTLEPAPDSSPLRVSQNTQFESGIPPARMREERGLVEANRLTLDEGIERLDVALSGVTRTEGSLGLLLRGLKHLAAGAAAARDANTELIHELDALRAHLARTQDEEQAMCFRMSQLEQLLQVVRHESARERAFLIEQQDLFLTEIMNDHERQIGELQSMIREGARHAGDSAQVAELTAQRDQAREYATRCERERDLAWQELASAADVPPPTVRRPSSPSNSAATPPPLPATPQASSSASGTTAIGSISLKAVQVPARASEPGRPATAYSLPGSGEDSAD